MTDDPRAILAEMTERERLVAIGYVRDPQDVPRLLAAVGAALERADRWDADAAGLDRDVTQGRKSPYPGDHALSDTDEALARELRQCADGLRADVLAALTGKDKTDD